jgi:predicted nucleotide-binding protein
VILHEQPSLGRAILEKLAEEGEDVDLVFVLLTPDDVGGTADQPDDVKRRARQNVIFELGFFLGRLGRRSGRVVLLHKGQTELPSDISGLISIDISSGIAAAGEEIRRELSWLL